VLLLTKQNLEKPTNRVSKMKIEIDLSQYMDSEKIEEFSLSHVINLIKQYPNDLFTWGDVGSISFHPHILMPIEKDREKCEILIRPIFEYFLDCSEADEDGEIQNLKDWGSFFKGLSDDFNAKAVDFRPIQTKADVEPDGATEVDSTGVYYKYDPKLVCSHYVWMNEDSYNPKIEDRWRLMPDGNIESATLMRSIADIKRIVELEKERDDLNGKFEEYFDAFMNCKCIPRNMEVHNLEQQVKGIKSLKFPTMLRKMWTGGDVQKWILEQAKSKGGAE
jgi:hypothetical protein